MDVLTAISERHSTRAFLDKPVLQFQIIQILDIAKHAPSGVNTQPWKVTVVGKNHIQKIGQAIVHARDNQQPEHPDYQYYPSEWKEPYKTRRKACGLALYSSLNIGMEDTEKRKEAWYRNYYFFGAPVGLLFWVDAALSTGAWVDCAFFIQNVMLAARGFGLETCPQASLAEYPDLVRSIVGVPASFKLICGMAMGYEDKTEPVNQYRTAREAVEVFTDFVD